MLKPINREYKNRWLKSIGAFEEQTRKPLKLTIEKIRCCQKNFFANLEDFNPNRFEVDKTRHNPTKDSRKKPVVVKSVLEPSCKRFSAIRENFNIKAGTTDERTQSHKGPKNSYQYSEVKENLCTYSII